MQLRIEVKGKDYWITAEFDDPECAYRVLEIAQAQEKLNAGLLPPLAKAMPPVEEQAFYDPGPVAVEKAKSRKPSVKVEEKPVGAAPVVPAPPAPPPAPEPVQAAPSAANGHTDVAAFMKTATDACMAAVVRNQPGVRALLKEFGIERFRDLGEDMPRVQAFYDRVVLV